MAENGTTVGTVVATDADAGDNITGYAISGGADQGKFSIDTNGALTFKSAPNYEAPTDAGTDNTYAVAVTATSGTSTRALTATQTITVTVTDVAEPPSAPATPTISAVTETGFTVSWTAPANTGPAITAYAVQYRVSGGTWADAGHSGTGLSVAVTGLTANTGYEVQVKATNAEGTSAWSATATAMTTAAANAAPTFSSANTFNVAENGTTVGTVVATDADAGDNITGYAISGGADQGKFSIDTNGALTFKSAPNYEDPTDAGTDNDYAVEVTATGGTSPRALTATQTITVTVTDVGGEAPSAPSAPTISSVTASGFTVSWTAPANTGPAITAYAVQYRVSGGTWADAGHSGTGLSVAVTGLTANTGYEVQVKATNAEGTSAWSATATATTTTTAATNAAPTFTSAATFSVAEKTTTVGTVRATDADAGDNITGYAISGGADQALFSIDGSSGALTFQSAPSFETPADANTDNVYEVEVTATSGTSPRTLTAVQAITVTVTDVDGEAPTATPTVNAAPTFTSAATFSVAENEITVGTVRATDADALDSITGYAISGGADQALFSIDGSSGALTFQSAPSFEAPADVESRALANAAGNNEYILEVTATSGEGDRARTAVQTITVTVTDVDEVNTAPTFTSAATFSVAENATAVGTVVATDSDEDDTITGYALTGGADQGQLAITNAGALTFTSAPNYEAPTDADTDNAYVVVVSATSGEGERALTATQTLTVTVTNQSEAPSAPATPTVSGETASSLTVTWTAPANTGPAITGYEVQYRAETGGAWTDAGHSGPALTVTLTGLTAGTRYEVRVRAANADGPGAWSGAATGTTTSVDLAAKRIEQATETVQPEMQRAMVSGTLDVVTQRMEQPRGGEAQASLGGQSSLLELLRSNEAVLNGESEIDWKRVLETSSFSVPVSGLDMSGEFELWGRGAWRSLSGGRAEELTWKGEVLSAHLGADWRPRPEVLAGVALSWHEGDVDYAAADGAKGTSRSRMTSVHPYLSWSPREGSSLWMSVGLGRGTLEMKDEEAPGRHTGDTGLRMVGAGGRVRVLSSEGWLGDGTSSLDLKGEGWLARTDVAGNGGLLADDVFDARRFRLVAEGTHETQLSSGSVLTPLLELGLRHDGGDGETGFGVEIGGGLRYADTVAGLTSEIRVRALAAHQGALNEWGVGGMIRYAPGASGRGLSFSISPALGATESGTERLWGQDVSGDSLAAEGKAKTSAFRLESELGYGIAAPVGKGVLTPYGGVTWSQEDARRYRLGIRLEQKPELSLGLEIDRSSKDTGGANHGILLKGTLHW